MTLAEAIEARHSVRKYIRKPLSADIIQTLQKEIGECNKLGHLNIQLITNEPKAFSGMMSYGVFTGVENYLVMAGTKSDDLDERIGYYGERTCASGSTDWTQHMLGWPYIQQSQKSLQSPL